jgi:hypothetical protein
MWVLRSVMRFTEPENASDPSGIPNGVPVLPRDEKATDDVLDQRLCPQAERQPRHHANEQGIISSQPCSTALTGRITRSGRRRSTAARRSTSGAPCAVAIAAAVSPG